MNPGIRSDALKKISAFFRSDKGRRIAIAAGITGIALIFLSEFRPHHAKTGPPAATAEEYVLRTEDRLKAMIESIDGAGECRVMVTLENGIEYVYAKEEKNNSDRTEDKDTESSRLSQRDDNEQSVIIVETDHGREGLLVTEIQPTVKGVVVVCSGGGRAEVQEQIIRAVTTALNISSQRVCVTKLT